jgi:hypothetical protein
MLVVAMFRGLLLPQVVVVAAEFPLEMKFLVGAVLMVVSFLPVMLLLVLRHLW